MRIAGSTPAVFSGVSDSVLTELITSPQAWTDVGKLISAFRIIYQLSSYDQISDPFLRTALKNRAGTVYLGDLVVKAYIDVVLDAFVARDPSFPRPIWESIAYSIWNAFTLDLTGQIIDQSILIGREAAGLWSDMERVREGYSLLQENIETIHGMVLDAKAQQDMDRYRHLLRLEASLQETVSDLTDQYTIGGVNVLISPGWTFLSVFGQ
jgi:hypothetical protein